jgi:hypothetical protein
MPAGRGTKAQATVRSASTRSARNHRYAARCFRCSGPPGVEVPSTHMDSQATDYVLGWAGGTVPEHSLGLENHGRSSGFVCSWGPVVADRNAGVARSQRSGTGHRIAGGVRNRLLLHMRVQKPE